MIYEISRNNPGIVNQHLFLVRTAILLQKAEVGQDYFDLLLEHYFTGLYKGSVRGIYLFERLSVTVSS